MNHCRNKFQAARKLSEKRCASIKVKTEHYKNLETDDRLFSGTS